MKLTRVFAVVVVAAGVYFRFLRAPILTWGATDSEAGARLAGDELLEDADGVSTRAVHIDAPASAVWPWIAQMGPAPRGGAYTYDWIENLLGLDMHSVDRVLPEFQQPQIGDTIGYGQTSCASSASIQSVSLRGALTTATGCGRSSSRGAGARPGSSAATAFVFPRSRLGSACFRWSRRHSSWSGRCCAASDSVRNGSPQMRSSATDRSTERDVHHLDPRAA